MSHNSGRFLDLPAIYYWEYHLSADTGKRDCDVYGLILLAVLVHISVEDSLFREFLRPIRETLVDNNRRVRRRVIAVLIPLFLLGYTYSIIAQRANPPGSPRDAHPSPPLELTYKDEVIGTMQDVVNPFRHYEKDDPEAFKAHVENGRRVYHQKLLSVPWRSS